MLERLFHPRNTGALPLTHARVQSAPALMLLPTPARRPGWRKPSPVFDAPGATVLGWHKNVIYVEFA